MTKISDVFTKDIKDLNSRVNMHDLILNGQPQHDIPGLVHKHKETRIMVESHEEYLKKKKWVDHLVRLAGNALGGALMILVIELIKSKLL